MRYDDFLELVRTRRTIRAIEPDPIPDDVVARLLEAARWAPTGFNMQPVEYLVLRDEGLRRGINAIVDDYTRTDFFPLEATREEWQGSQWTIAEHGEWRRPLAPVYILVLGDTRRRVGLPMAARYSRQKGDSIFESSLANAFLYILLAAHSLDLAAQPMSAVKYPKVQGLVKDLLNLPEFVYVYDIVQVGVPSRGGRPANKTTRELADLVHYDRAADDEFMDEDALRRQIRELRAGNVGRHTEAGG